VAVEEQAPEAVDEAASGAAGKPSHVLRRSFLAGLFGAVVGGGGYLVTAGVLPGRTTLFETLGLDGSDGALPRVEPGELHLGSFRSAARGDADTGWVLALPPGVAFDRLKAPGRQPLPVCVLLHGRGDSATSLVDIGYDRFLAGATMTGVPPFAIAAVDGGDRYWHRRSAGDDTGRMIVDELLPMLARAGLRSEPRDRIALMGYSMGGYGALLLGSELGPARVAAVVAESPALWTSPAEAAPGAFAGTADFVRNDVFARRKTLAEIPIKIDCGLADPFYRAAKQFAEGMDPAPAGTFGRGDHDYGYWRAVAPSSVAFVGQALARS